MFWPDLANFQYRFEQEAGAVLKAAAIYIGALIGERRIEAVQEVTVRAMDFQPFKSGSKRSPCRCCKGILYKVYFFNASARGGCGNPV